MPSPVIEPETNTTPVPPKRGGFWLWLALIVFVGIPALLTAIGALTAPPHATDVPVGRLIYLDTDQPSEHTTQLRGLYLAAPGEQHRLLLHEDESQDLDTGQREWITQPLVSPDGHQIAFIKQLITLDEEKQAIINQLWVTTLDGTGAKPRLLLDLTKAHLKSVVGLMWSSDSRQVSFLEDAAVYSVTTGPTPEVMHAALPEIPSLLSTGDISATRSPQSLPNGGIAFLASTAGGQQLYLGAKPVATAHGFALSPDAARIAYLPSGASNLIRIIDAQTGKQQQDISARWGWSIFGGRHLTSVRWSPDGKYLGYTVSKPPVPEDELFTVDITSHAIHQLPFRCGRAAWDWAK